jgi:peptidyl-dipeptidase Dcp
MSEPKVIVFTCNWNAYSGLETAGFERRPYPASVRPLKVQCLGRLSPGIILKAFEKGVFADTQLYPDAPESCMSTAFSHIFQGGYSSGYYSYKWAEVLDADAFEAFKENGIFDEETGSKFKSCILSRGGTEKPMELYVKFRGREPDANALLRRAGLLSKTPG